MGLKKLILQKEEDMENNDEKEFDMMSMIIKKIDSLQKRVSYLESQHNDLEKKVADQNNNNMSSADDNLSKLLNVVTSLFKDTALTDSEHREDPVDTKIRIRAPEMELDVATDLYKSVVDKLDKKSYPLYFSSEEIEFLIFHASDAIYEKVIKSDFVPNSTKYLLFHFRFYPNFLNAEDLSSYNNIIKKFY
jgi:hypothetical protein